MMSALVFLSCRVSDTLGAIVVPSVSNNRPCSHHVQASSMITGPFLSLRIIIRLSHPSSSAWTISLVSNASIASHPREWVTKRSYDVYDNAMVFLWEQDKMQVNQLFGFGQRYKKSFFYQRKVKLFCCICCCEVLIKLLLVCVCVDEPQFIQVCSLWHNA